MSHTTLTNFKNMKKLINYKILQVKTVNLQLTMAWPKENTVKNYPDPNKYLISPSKYITTSTSSGNVPIPIHQSHLHWDVHKNIQQIIHFNLQFWQYCYYIFLNSLSFTLQLRVYTESKLSENTMCEVHYTWSRRPFTIRCPWSGMSIKQAQSPTFIDVHAPAATFTYLLDIISDCGVILACATFCATVFISAAVSTTALTVISITFTWIFHKLFVDMSCMYFVCIMSEMWISFKLNF